MKIFPVNLDVCENAPQKAHTFIVSHVNVALTSLTASKTAPGGVSVPKYLKI